MEKITTITPAQQKLIDRYNKRKNDVTYSTKRTNRKNATIEIKKFYKTLGDKFPNKVIFTQSPMQALIVMNELDLGDDKKLLKTLTPRNNNSWVKKITSNITQKSKYKYFEPYVLDTEYQLCMFYMGISKSFPTVEYTKQIIEKMVNIIKLAESTGTFMFINKSCVILTDRPTEIIMDGDTLKKVIYSDGFVAIPE